MYIHTETLWLVFFSFKNFNAQIIGEYRENLSIFEDPALNLTIKSLNEAHEVRNPLENRNLTLGLHVKQNSNRDKYSDSINNVPLGTEEEDGDNVLLFYS